MHLGPLGGEDESLVVGASSDANSLGVHQTTVPKIEKIPVSSVADPWSDPDILVRTGSGKIFRIQFRIRIRPQKVLRKSYNKK